MYPQHNVSCCVGIYRSSNNHLGKHLSLARQETRFLSILTKHKETTSFSAFLSYLLLFPSSFPSSLLLLSFFPPSPFLLPSFSFPSSLLLSFFPPSLLLLPSFSLLLSFFLPFPFLLPSLSPTPSFRLA